MQQAGVFRVGVSTSRAQPREVEGMAARVGRAQRLNTVSVSGEIPKRVFARSSTPSSIRII
jgi:hypothetical protein